MEIPGMEETEDLDAWFAREDEAEPVEQLGLVVGGSLSKGLDVKLDRRSVIEGLAVGRYVVVHGQTGRRFFSIVTDVALDSTNPLIEKYPPAADADFVRQVYDGITAFGRLHVAPMLIVEEGITLGDFRPVNVKMAVLGLLGMLNWTHQWFSPDGMFSSQEIAAVLADLALHGLVRQEGDA